MPERREPRTAARKHLAHVDGRGGVPGSAASADHSLADTTEAAPAELVTAAEPATAAEPPSADARRARPDVGRPARVVAVERSQVQLEAAGHRGGAAQGAADRGPRPAADRSDPARVAPPVGAAQEPIRPRQAVDERVAEAPVAHDTAAFVASRTPVLLAVLMVATAALVAMGWSSTRASEYEAVAEIRYRVGAETSFANVERELNAQAMAVRSRSVVVAAAEEVGLDPGDLADGIRSSIVEGSDILDVRYRDTSPERAEAVLQAVVTRYLEATSSGARYAAVTARIDERIAEIDDRLEVIDVALASAEDELGLTARRLATEQAALFDERAGLSSSLTELSVLALDGSAASLITEPYASDERVAPDPVRAGVVGAAAALPLALGLLYVRLRRRLVV